MTEQGDTVTNIMPKEFVLGFREPTEGEPPGLKAYCDPPDEGFLGKIRDFAEQVRLDPEHRRYEIQTNLKDPSKITYLGKAKNPVAFVGLRIIAQMGTSIIRQKATQNEYTKLQVLEVLCESILPKLTATQTPMEVAVNCDSPTTEFIVRVEGKTLTISMPNVHKGDLWAAWAEQQCIQIVRVMTLSFLQKHGQHITA